VLGGTAVVLDAHVDLRINQVGRDVDGLLRVDGHFLVLCSVVGGACGYPQLVLFVERGHVGLIVLGYLKNCMQEREDKY
jgi:hypothetical protein